MKMELCIINEFALVANGNKRNHVSLQLLAVKDCHCARSEAISAFRAEIATG